jgi:hypothetical protein
MIDDVLKKICKDINRYHSFKVVGEYLVENGVYYKIVEKKKKGSKYYFSYSYEEDYSFIDFKEGDFKIFYLKQTDINEVREMRLKKILE